MYEQRFYRAWSKQRPLERFELKIEESDLLILFDAKDKQALRHTAEAALRSVRSVLKSYIRRVPDFARSMTPIEVEEDAPETIRQMARAAHVFQVGPMAAVAGAVAEFVARALSSLAETVLVENGGDIFGVSRAPVRFALYAGEASPFKNALTFETGALGGVAVCTSSGRIGPSMSMGKADAVVAIHREGATADAAATSIANEIRTPSDVGPVVETEQSKHRLKGLIACMEDKLGMWGEITLIDSH